MKIAYTVDDLRSILEKMDDLPLSQGVEVNIGYRTPVGFVNIDEVDKKPEESFLCIDVNPVVQTIDLESYEFSFVEE